ncbi:hypothetical protein JCM10908_001519 [Rhodotorula pacifica]|uniref:urease accessory protein UreD n=1 Tax=Rhodotorula pacifica TaxID=1495444 RepID=UPI00316C656D
MDRRLSPGDGLLVLSSDSQHRAHVDGLQYSYPLKLIVPARRFLPGVQCVYVLSYGGGLVAGDRVRLKVEVRERSTLVMLTQGSTKVFKVRPGQYLTASAFNHTRTTEQLYRLSVARSACLVLLPAPVTCFSRARYSQRQVVRLADESSSLVLLDWYTSGRMAYGDARGEEWEFAMYKSENEVWLGEKRLAKDVLLLEDERPGGGEDQTGPSTNGTTNGTSAHQQAEPGGGAATYHSRVAPYSCYAALFLFGPHTAKLRAHLDTTFSAISHYNQSRPYSLVWSYSPLTGHPGGGGIARCAGASTEEVKEWIDHMLENGGIEELMGRELWKTALA